MIQDWILDQKRTLVGHLTKFEYYFLVSIVVLWLCKITFDEAE